MSKKVLIMSASTGGGHNRAARAIKEELESRTIDGMSIECEIVDSLKLVNNTMNSYLIIIFFIRFQNDFIPQLICRRKIPSINHFCFFLSFFPLF